MEAVRASEADLALVERLRAGDEAAFMELVDALGPSMRRVARMFVSTDAVADEVVQDAWLGVLRGLHRFEGRASLRTWILRIVVNIAKTRGTKEARSVPFATLAGDDLDQPAWDPAAFVGAGGATAGHWSTLPFDWRGVPEDRLEAAETLAVIGRTLEALPPMQAEVLRLRDVLGWSSVEVRNALDLTDTNQRVLLHRARAKVRAAIEEHLRSVIGSVSTAMVCRDVVELLNDYLDGTLSPEEHTHVQEHLDGCDGCTTVLEQFRMTIATTGRIDRDRVPADQREILLGAFRHHVQG